MTSINKETNKSGKTINAKLKLLIAKISSHNRHPEVDWGKRRGKEVW